MGLDLSLAAEEKTILIAGSGLAYQDRGDCDSSLMVLFFRGVFRVGNIARSSRLLLHAFTVSPLGLGNISPLHGFTLHDFAACLG